MIKTGIHDIVAAEIEPFGGFLRCETCRRVEALGETANHLRAGWPRCCGYTMRWWTQRQIAAGEVPNA